MKNENKNSYSRWKFHFPTFVSRLLFATIKWKNIFFIINYFLLFYFTFCFAFAQKKQHEKDQQAKWIHFCHSEKAEKEEKLWKSAIFYVLAVTFYDIFRENERKMLWELVWWRHLRDFGGFWRQLFLVFWCSGLSRRGDVLF